MFFLLFVCFVTLGILTWKHITQKKWVSCSQIYKSPSFLLKEDGVPFRQRTSSFTYFTGASECPPLSFFSVLHVCCMCAACHNARVEKSEDNCWDSTLLSFMRFWDSHWGLGLGSRHFLMSCLNLIFAFTYLLLLSKHHTAMSPFQHSTELPLKLP